MSKTIGAQDWDYTQVRLPLDLPRRLASLTVLVLFALAVICLWLALPGA